MRKFAVAAVVACLVAVACAALAAPKVSVTKYRGIYDGPILLGGPRPLVTISNAGPYGPITVSGWRHDATSGWIPAELDTSYTGYATGDSVMTIFAGQSLTIRYLYGADLLYVKTVNGYSTADSNEAAFNVMAE